MQMQKIDVDADGTYASRALAMHLMSTAPCILPPSAFPCPFPPFPLLSSHLPKFPYIIIYHISYVCVSQNMILLIYDRISFLHAVPWYVVYTARTVFA